MDNVLKDKRFAQISKDPRFRKEKNEKRKFKVDKRFQSMFTDKRFKMSYSVDKRGKPGVTSTNEKLHKYYEIEKSDDENSDAESEEDSDGGTGDESDAESSEESTQESIEESSGEDSEQDIKKKHKKMKEKKETEEVDMSSDSESDDNLEDEEDEGIDFARGEGNVSSSSDDSDSESDSDGELDHHWNEEVSRVPMADDATHRIAACNLNWDRVKAQDIIMMLMSFTPSGGVVKSVTIYPSEFGAERMKIEELNGPMEYTELKKSKDSTDEQYNQEVLRKYQMNRLKYYYAVVVCDSAETANHIYSNCDGVEHESTGNKMDLRFIPDHMTFDQKPRETATSADADNYKPTTFVTAALQLGKVESTWDETDHKRVAATKRKFTKEELEDMDFNQYLASDSSCDEDAYAGLKPCKFASKPKKKSDDQDANTYKQLLLGDSDSEDNDNKPEGDMEITWDSGIVGATRKLVKEKEEKAKTPWERYLEKRNEKKKARKKGKNSDGSSDEDDRLPSDSDDIPDCFDPADLGPEFETESKKSKKKKKKSKEDSQEKQPEMDAEEKAKMELLMMDEEDDKQHFNLDNLVKSNAKLSKRAKKRKLLEEKEQPVVEDTFKMNFKDSRFDRLFTDSAFNIDPSIPNFKKTAVMEGLITEKLNRRKEQQAKQAKKAKKKKVVPKESTGDNELNSLVASLKAKTQNMQKKKKKNKPTKS